MSELGAGVDLNEDWDFEVNQTGDLQTIVGIGELEKDIAFNVTRNLDDSLGQSVNSNTAKRIQVVVTRVLGSEPRVASIRNVTVNDVERSNTFEIVTDVNTVGGPTNLVFEVST